MLDIYISWGVEEGEKRRRMGLDESVSLYRTTYDSCDDCATSSLVEGA